jgi:membrane-anchored protein YejM (alkaline phosphatase superfamily)
MYCLGLILLCLVSVDKYSWMSEMDPSLSAGSVSADTSNSDLTSLVIFIGIMVVQLISVVVEKSRKMKLLAVILALIAACVFIARTHYV